MSDNHEGTYKYMNEQFRKCFEDLVRRKRSNQPLNLENLERLLLSTQPVKKGALARDAMRPPSEGRTSVGDNVSEMVQQADVSQKPTGEKSGKKGHAHEAPPAKIVAPPQDNRASTHGLIGSRLTAPRVPRRRLNCANLFIGQPSPRQPIGNVQNPMSDQENYELRSPVMNATGDFYSICQFPYQGAASRAVNQEMENNGEMSD